MTFGLIAPELIKRAQEAGAEGGGAYADAARGGADAAMAKPALGIGKILYNTQRTTSEGPEHRATASFSHIVDTAYINFNVGPISITEIWEFVLLIIIAFVLSAYLEFGRRRVMARLYSRASGVKLPPRSGICCGLPCKTLFHTFKLCAQYICMILAMLNLWLLIAVVLGGALGYTVAYVRMSQVTDSKGKSLLPHQNDED